MVWERKSKYGRKRVGTRNFIKKGKNKKKKRRRFKF